MTTADAVAREILTLLARHASYRVSAEAALAELRQRIPGVDANVARATFRRLVLQAFFPGGMRLYSMPPANMASPSARPQALASARHEASYRPAVTNGRHEQLQLNDFERALILKLDEEVRPALERFAATAFLCA